jgi:hypothetical protein
MPVPGSWGRLTGESGAGSGGDEGIGNGRYHGLIKRAIVGLNIPIRRWGNNNKFSEICTLFSCLENATPVREIRKVECGKQKS